MSRRTTTEDCGCDCDPSTEARGSEKSSWEDTRPSVEAKERRIGPAEQEQDHASVVKTAIRARRIAGRGSIEE